MSGNDSTCTAILSDGGSVLERVLLAIIDTHSPDETEAHQAERLQTAMVAPIGRTKQDVHKLERALLFMARERQKNICDFEIQHLQSGKGPPIYAGRSIPQLATITAREVFDCTTVAEVERTASLLCGIFRQRSHLYEAGSDHVREAKEAEAVKRILDELSEWNVPTRL